MINKKKIIDEIVRIVKNKAGFDTNYVEIKKIKNDIRTISSKLSRLEKMIKDA
jgi:hypothetical protein